MSYLIDAIRDQKLLDAEVSINDFIEENNISDNALIFEIELSKDRFETEQEALEYVKSKWYSVDEISDDGDSYIVKTCSRAQLDLDSEIKIELSRGVTVKAADFRPEVSDSFLFGDKGLSLKKLSTVNLSDGDGVPFIIELCKVVDGEHASYGKIKITSEDLKSMERNFKEQATGIDLAINEDHKKENAYGWIKDVFTSREGDVLYGQVIWNSKGISALSDKEYRYLSPEFKFSYTHPHTGQSFGPTLMGAALTNYPFLKMEAIVELNNKQSTTELEMEKTISLTDHTKEVVELNSKINELEKVANKSTVVITKLKEEKVELSEKVKELESEKELSEKTAKNEKLFSENKINKAQLEALNSGKDLFEVLALSEKAPGEPKGGSGGSNDLDTFNLSDEDKKMAKRMGLSDKEYVEFGCDDE